jgi:hypothetical protein
LASSILAPTRRSLEQLGANLASGITSTLLNADGADLGLLEVDEFALPEVMRRTHPRSCASATSFATSSTATASSSTSPSAGATAVAGSLAEPTLVANADDPLVAALATAVGARCASASTIPARARRPPARLRLEVLHPLRHPYRYDAAYVGHLGAYRCEACGHARPPLDVARARSSRRPRRRLLRARTPDGSARVRLGVPGLYNVYNALARRSLALSLDVALDDVVAGLERFRAAFGRFERFSVGDRGFLLLLVKNPAGANEALRTLEEGGVPPALVVALNDRIADGRDVSLDLGRRLRARARRRRADRGERRARGGAGAALHVRRIPP